MMHGSVNSGGRKPAADKHVLWRSALERNLSANLCSCIGEESLIGMGLLNGNELRIEVTRGGMVEINELP